MYLVLYVVSHSHTTPPLEKMEAVWLHETIYVLWTEGMCACLPGVYVLYYNYY